MCIVSRMAGCPNPGQRLARPRSCGVQNGLFGRDQFACLNLAVHTYSLLHKLRSRVSSGGHQVHRRQHRQVAVATRAALAPLLVRHGGVGIEVVLPLAGTQRHPLARRLTRLHHRPDLDTTAWTRLLLHRRLVWIRLVEVAWLPLPVRHFLVVPVVLQDGPIHNMKAVSGEPVPPGILKQVQTEINLVHSERNCPPASSRNAGREERCSQARAI